MSKLSKTISQLRLDLVEAINRAALPPCVAGMVLEQVHAQLRLLEAQEDAQTDEEKEEDDGAIQGAK